MNRERGQSPNPSESDQSSWWVRSSILQPEAMRSAEREAARRLGISTLMMMESAGARLAAVAHEAAAQDDDGSILILAGPGQNGGDGFVAARYLLSMGAKVDVRTVAQRGEPSGDAKVNFDALIASGLKPKPIQQHDGSEWIGDSVSVVVDAVFGIGLSRRVEGEIAAVFEAVNGWRASGGVIVAADLPSGLDAASGTPLGISIEADRTVAFGALKPAHVRVEAARFIGEVEVAPIGIPRSLLDEFGERHEPSLSFFAGRSGGTLPATKEAEKPEARPDRWGKAGDSNESAPPD